VEARAPFAWGQLVVHRHVPSYPRVIQWVLDPFDGICGLDASLRWDSPGQHLLGPRHGFGCLEFYRSGSAAEGLTLSHPCLFCPGVVVELKVSQPTNPWTIEGFAPVIPSQRRNLVRGSVIRCAQRTGVPFQVVFSGRRNMCCDGHGRMGRLARGQVQLMWRTRTRG
jgi:hypothetical protein